MQDLILDMGAANGLSEAEMVDLRANAADRQAILNLALDVSTRYATAPTPSQDMLAAVDNTPVSDLTAELTACAEVADSIAYQVDYPGNEIGGRDIAGGDRQSCHVPRRTPMRRLDPLHSAAGHGRRMLAKTHTRPSPTESPHDFRYPLTKSGHAACETELLDLAGEPGFAAKLNVARKSLETLTSPVANLAIWTMPVANGQGPAVGELLVLVGLSWLDVRTAKLGPQTEAEAKTADASWQRYLN